MTLEKNIAYIPQPANNERKIIFLHTKRVTQNKDLLAKFIELKNKNYDVYLIPQQSPFDNFLDIKENTPKGLTPLGIFVFYKRKNDF